MSRRRYLFLAPAVGAVLALSACSGSGSATSAGAGSSDGTSTAAGAPTPDPARRAAIETYLRCLRDNGADVPTAPPTPGSTRPAPPTGTALEKLRKAQQACADKRPAPPPGGPGGPGDPGGAPTQAS